MRRKSLIALAVAVGLVFTACGGGGSKKEGGQAGDNGKGGPSATANDINATPREKVADGGILKWPVDQIPPNLNYHQIDGTLRDTSDIISGLMPGLFNFDAASVPSINKDYLDAADLTATQPKQVITYKLNPKATWSDGTPITWADFEAEWKANNGTNPAFFVPSTGTQAGR